MTSRFFMTAFAATCSLSLFAGACNAGNISSSKEAVSTQSDYVKTSKPGAAIEFSHTGNNISSGSTSKEMRIQIIDGYDSGILKVKVIGNQNLSVSGSGAYTFDMSRSQPHEIVLTVNPLSQGKHYLNFTAIAEYGQGQVARSNYALPIYSGVKRLKSLNEVNTNPEKTLANPGIIVMDAEETIITQLPE